MKKIAFIGGGSGGHIMPIVAIYNTLKHEPDMSFVWIGEKGAMDEAKAREYEIPFRGIISDKLRRYFSLRSIIAPFKIAFGFFQAYYVLNQEKPDAIFSKGGPVAFPVSLAAWLLHIPLSLHESDTVPGLANRVSAKFARKIFLGFAEARKFFDIPKTQVVGQILDPVFEEYLETAGLPLLPVGDRTKVLIFCGSQGSTMIFEKVLTMIDTFPQVDFTIVLGTLNTHLHEKFEGFSNVRVFDWADRNMLCKLYHESDIAIMRPGATSLAEMQMFAIRMIMIPLGVSSYYHQYHNAVSWMGTHEGHAMLEEKDLDQLPKILAAQIGTRKTALEPKSELSAVAVIASYLKGN